jgi:predicted nucleic acid-binding protein
MKIYLDTSSLIKLYHTETETEKLDDLFNSNSIETVFLSEITKVEFNSAIQKKARTKDLSSNEATRIIETFEADYGNFSFVKIDYNLILQARELISKYATEGLRTLDSIQLASIISAKQQIAFAITADKLLLTLIHMEGVNTL